MRSFLRILRGRSIITLMAHSRRHPGLGKSLLFVLFILVVQVAGCGDGTAIRDAGILTDAAYDLADGPSLPETGTGPADMPAPSLADAADSLVPDVAIERAPLDGETIDTMAVDVRSGADPGALDTAAAVDGSAAEVLADSVQRFDLAADLYVDPLCSSADSAGFFASCTACLDPSNCDSVTVGSRTRRACGCAADTDCPCGFTCGCYEIAPSIQVCSVCTR